MERESITPARLREYNEFGPWIIEIRDESMMPRLFCKHYSEESRPELLIKIPAKIERRLATPLMDLYDYVVGAFDNYLLILKRKGRDVQEIKVPYHEITAIQKANSLLKGELLLYLRDSVINVDYSTVSDDFIVRLTGIIQKKKRRSDSAEVQFESMTVEYDPNKSGSMDLWLCNITNKVIEADPAMKLVAFQTAVSDAPQKPGKTSERIRAFFKVRKRRLTEGSILSDGKELVIVKCDVTARKKSVDKYTYSNTYIPIQSITDIKMIDSGIPMVRKLRIKASNRTFEFIFEEKNEGIRDLYDRLKTKQAFM